MKRWLSLLGFAWAALGRRRARTAALFLGLFSIVTVFSAAIFFASSLVAEATRGADQMPDLVVQRIAGGRTLNVELAARTRLESIPGVLHVQPRIWGAFFSSALQGNITVVGEPSSANGHAAAARVLASGRMLAAGKHEMVIGKTLADALGIQLGDTLALPAERRATPSLTVVGMFRSELDLHTADVVLVDEADAREQLGVPTGEATDFAIELANAAEARVAAGHVLALLADCRVIQRSEMQGTYTLVYGRRAGLVSLALLPALLTMLLLAIDRLAGASDRERREVAVLKAVGWSTDEVLTVKLLEALLVGVCALSFGLAAAYAWIFFAGGVGLRQALMGYSVLYPTAALTPAVDFAQLLSIALLVLGPFVGVSVVPAWRAAQADPHSVMRGE